MATPCMTRVVLKKSAGRALKNAVLVHAFGDSLTERFTWDEISSTAVQSASRTVHYSVGFGSMTSYDWWSLSWEEEELLSSGEVRRYACSTSPSVLNIISDHFLSQGRAGIDAGGSAASHAVAAGTLLPSALVTTGAGAATGMASFFLGGILRSVSKRDLYNANLKQEDAYRFGSVSPEISFQIGLFTQDRGTLVIVSASRGEIARIDYHAVDIPIDLGEA